MSHDGYEIFRHFWWLIFPLFWMLAGAARLWTRHARANRLIDLMKTYAEQGKEPPPEVLQALRGPFGRHAGEEWHGHRRGRGHGWVPVFLFAALALGFLMLAWTRDPQAPWADHSMGLVFVAIIMAGLCLGNLVAVLSRRGEDDNRTLPK